MPEKAARYGEVLMLFEIVGAGDVVGVATTSGVGEIVRVEPGAVIVVPVGVGRDFVGDGVCVALVGVLLWDGAGEWVCGREGAVVRCVCWFAVSPLVLGAGVGRTHRYSTNTPANRTRRTHVERRVRSSRERSGRHISRTPSPAPSRRSWSR